jgi:hypothetical protein
MIIKSRWKPFIQEGLFMPRDLTAEEIGNLVTKHSAQVTERNVTELDVR